MRWTSLKPVRDGVAGELTATLDDPEQRHVGETELVEAGNNVVTVKDGKRTLQVLQPGMTVLFVVDQLDCTEATFRYWTWPKNNLNNPR